MLVFADSGWQIFSSFLVFFLGLWFALAQRAIFSVSQKRAVFLYLWHTAFCLFYFYYSLNYIADSRSYFLESLKYEVGFDVGTRGIYFLTSIFSAGFGLSYGGAFLVYNIFGFIGMLAIASALQQIQIGSSRFARQIVWMTLLLPGVSFWSSSIGKDALTFMGAGLACWAVLNLSRRYPAMIVAFVGFLFARPHMAGILAASFALTLVLFLRKGIIAKSFLILLVVPLGVVAVIYGLDYAGLNNPTSLGAIFERIEVQQGQNLWGGSSVALSEMSVPMRLITYMFRPMLFDTSGILGLVVSLENIFLLAMFTIAFFSAVSNRSSLSRFQLAFYSTFTLVALLVLANSTANLGIALRQKWMFLPMMLMLAMSVIGQPRKAVRYAAPTRWRDISGMPLRSARPPQSAPIKRGDG